ncbi:MAG: helix-turn-helix transcriptional regulator [Actinomycetota bacterium]|nr:helix-turn-helix transcriptional regulator [Actinomycetota bacterium]
MDSSVGYREVPPPPALRHGVSAFWIRTMPRQPGPPVEVWPDAGVDIIWQQGDGPLLAGADTGPMPATLEPGVVLVGARLRPGAAGPALHLPMYEVRDRRVFLSDVAPKLARSLPGDLTPDVAFRRLCEMTGRLLTEGGPDPIVTGGAEQLRDPGTSLDDLLLQTSLSGRQLRRRFQHALGYGPKTLQRVLRFQRAVALLDAGADLATTAARAGYADQAHMTRECRRLSGKTPSDLARAVVAESFKTAAG